MPTALFLHGKVSIIWNETILSLVSWGFAWSSWDGLRHDLLAGSRSLTTYINTCGMYCTGFHSHSSSHTGSHPWCGGACLAGCPPICRTLFSCAGRRTLRSSVHGSLVFPFARSATMQTLSFSVVGATTWNGLSIDLRHLSNGACSQFHQLLKTSFLLGLGRERLWVGILKGHYLNFDWLIDWLKVLHTIPSGATSK